MAEVEAGAVAPVVPATPAVEPAPAPESTAEQVTEAPAGSDTPVAPERTFTQKELDEIVAKRAAQAERRAVKIAKAEAERDYYKRLAEEKAPQPAAQGEPKAEDFKDWESYNAALIDYRVEQRLKGVQQESAAQQQQRQAAERAQAVRAKLETAKSKYEDFEEVALGDHVTITEPMAAAIADSDHGGDLAYYLGSHPDEASKIARLSPVKQIRALADLEAKITAPPKPTQAPPPIVPNGTKTTVEKDPATMTDKEFASWRKRQIAQRGNR